MKPVARLATKTISSMKPKYGPAAVRNRVEMASSVKHIMFRTSDTDIRFG